MSGMLLLLRCFSAVIRQKVVCLFIYSKHLIFSSVTNLDIYPPNVRVPGGLLVDQREGETSSTMMVLSGKNYPLIKNVSHFPSPFGHNGQGQQILRANKSPQ